VSGAAEAGGGATCVVATHHLWSLDAGGTQQCLWCYKTRPTPSVDLGTVSLRNGKGEFEVVGTFTRFEFLPTGGASSGNKK
jgi:hypothetical protein